MLRTLSCHLKDHLGEEVLLKGRVYNLREMGGINFLILQDRVGLVQIVFARLKNQPKIGSIVEITGKVQEEKRAPSEIEILGREIKVISEAKEELPIDLSKKELKLKLNTLLDHRPLTLRHENIKAIFKVSNIITEAYAKAMRNLGFTEIKTPKILGAASEGGSNFFKIDYFGRNAYLAQSPQLYKQICAGAFERVFEIGPVFRAEPHFTTRHINEYISLDAEMTFIDSYEDIMNTLNQAVSHIFKKLKENQINAPEVPEKIPRIKLQEIKKIIQERYGYEISEETDIDPRGELLAGKYAQEEFNSDFIFLTHYPSNMRPFYTLPDEENPEETKSFDLIFRGVEMVTGSQRIHDYDQLIANMKKYGIKEKGLEFYLDTFKYAMPPHGGWGMGLERIVKQLLGLKSIKEATLFPRDVKRLEP